MAAPVRRLEPAKAPPSQSPSAPPSPRRDEVVERRQQVGISPLLESIPTDLAETFHQLVSRLRLGAANGLTSRLAVVASSHGEGVTTVARSMAIVMANDLDARVCVVTFGRPVRRRNSDTELARGLFDVIANDVAVEDVLQPTADPRLSSLEIGAKDRAVIGQISRSPRLAAVIDELESLFDYVVLDVPPVLSGSDALALLRHAHSYLLVVKHGVTPIAHVRHTASELQSLPCIGVVINQYSTRIPKPLRRFFAP